MPVWHQKQQIVPRGGGGTTPSGTSSTNAQNRLLGMGVYVLQKTITGVNANQAYNAGSLVLDPSQTVEVWPLPGNAGLCFSAVGHPDTTLMPTGARAAQSPYSAPVPYMGLDNLNELWVAFANSGDGCLIRVLK